MLDAACGGSTFRFCRAGAEYHILGLFTFLLVIEITSGGEIRMVLLHAKVISENHDMSVLELLE